MARIDANLEHYEEQTDFSPIPPGEYLVVVSDSAVRESKNGNMMAEFVFTVQTPAEYRNRRIWDRFVLGNDVAMSRLKTLAKVVGHKNPNFIRDTEELHGGVFVAKVKIDEKAGYDPKNVVTSFKSAESFSAAQPKPFTQPPPQAPPSQPPQLPHQAPMMPPPAAASAPSPPSPPAMPPPAPPAQRKAYPWEKPA
jgi:hypothetical protein